MRIYADVNGWIQLILLIKNFGNLTEQVAINKRWYICERNFPWKTQIRLFDIVKNIRQILSNSKTKINLKFYNFFSTLLALIPVLVNQSGSSNHYVVLGYSLPGNQVLREESPLKAVQLWNISGLFIIIIHYLWIYDIALLCLYQPIDVETLCNSERRI